jgi:biotin carboxylase
LVFILSWNVWGDKEGITVQKKIIILGAGVMQGPAIRIAKELGFYTVVVDGSSTASCIGMADQFEQIDLKDKEGIEALARSLRDSGLGGIITAGTDFSATVAWVAERLNLPGIPYEAALNASDKGRMRSCFKKAGLPSPEFITITNTDVSENLSLPTSFPLVIKPVDNMGGRGCRRVNNIDKFSEAAADALRFSRSGRAIVEAFMDGPEFSVDAIVYHGEITICGLADRHIFFPPYFIEMGHTMPTTIAPEQQAALLETFCAGVRALGLAGEKNIGAAKGDIKLTPQGPMIGEIAARLSGGYMSGWTYPYASGVEPIRAAILAAMGRKPDGLVPLKTWTSAERAFISIPGTVKAIAGIELARNKAHVQDLFLRIAEGDKVNFPENNVSKCGNIISAASDRTTATEAAETAARSILIRLDPADGETQKFLFPQFLTQRHQDTKTQKEGEEGGAELTKHGANPLSSLNVLVPLCLCEMSSGRFPPDAFPLDPELQSALAALPETVIAPTPHSLYLVSFPAFAESGLKDYVGRSVAESLGAVRELTGFSLTEIPVKNRSESSDNDNYNCLGRSFWTALVRGGYQGAVYYIDRLANLRGEN